METSEKSDQPSLPLLTPKTASGSQRVIKQIMVIDPNKLRLAGLDIKMAEALKKAKPKKATKSKEDKLLAAKSILNKKIKEALKKKDEKSSLTSPQTLHSDVNSDDVPKKTRSKKTTESTTPRAKTKGVALKSLMPPPISPISVPTTVEFKVLKPEKNIQSIEVKILDSLEKIPEKIDEIPKASLQTIVTPKNAKPLRTQVAKNKLEPKQNSPSSTDRGVPPGPPVHGKSYQRLIENVKESIARNAKKESAKEKDISLPNHSKYLPEPPNIKTLVEIDDKSFSIEDDKISLIYTKESIVSNANKESAKEKDISLPIQNKNLPKPSNKKIEVEIHDESLPIEDEEISLIYTKVRNANKESANGKDISLPIYNKYLPETPNKTTQVKIHDESLPMEDEQISLVDTILPSVYEESDIEVNSSINMTTSMPVRRDFVNKVTESLQPITTMAPVRRESLPKVIESIVLSQENKIDISILTKKTPLTIPKKRYKLENNWITPEQEQKLVYINVSPVSEVTSPKPVTEESAVDFINNISMFFAESQTSASKPKSIPDILAKECSEDATSFLMSLFENKQEGSPKIESSAVENIQGEGLQSELSSCQEEENTKEEVILPTQHSKENHLLPPGHDGSSNLTTIHVYQDCSNNTIKSLIEPHFVKALQESLAITGAPNSQSETTSVQNYTPMTSNLESGKETIEASSDLNETNIDSTSVLLDVDKQLPMVPVNSSLSTAADSLQDLAPILVPQPVSSRRKGNKPIPILKPKLKKSRKPPTPAQKPPEDIKEVTTVEKNNEKPVEESPTQPVQNEEAVKESFAIKETEISSLSKTDEVHNINTNTTSQNSQQRRKDTPKSLEEVASPAISSLCLRKSAGIIEETPTTSKSRRPQRQRKLTLKLIESSESHTINSPLQIKEETKEIAEESPQNTETIEDPFPVVLEENAETDAMAQLLAFHETVEQFELLCAQNETSNETVEKSTTDVNSPSVSGNPFYDAICNDSFSRDYATNASHEIPAQHIAENIQTEGKENVSGKKSLTKPPRKRKDSLKTRKFDGEDISIVSSESLDKSEQTDKSNKFLTSVRQLRKRKETTVTGKFEDEQVLTPQLSTSLQKDFKHDVTCGKSVLDVELEPSLLTKSEPLSRTRPSVYNVILNEEETPSKPFRNPLPTETESPIDSSAKKRRGRTSKTQIQPQKIELTEKDVEIPQPPNLLCGNRNLDRSWETLPSGDEQFNTFDRIDSKNFAKNRQNSSLNNKIKDKVRDDTLDLKREMKEVQEKSVEIEENALKVNEVNEVTEDIIQKAIEERVTTYDKVTTDQKVITDKKDTPNEAKKKAREPKSSKSPYTQNEFITELNVTASSIENYEKVSTKDRSNYSPRVSKSTEKQTMKNNIQKINASIGLDGIPNEAQTHEEKPSTSRSSRKKIRLKSLSVDDEDLVEVIEVVRPIQLGTRSKKSSANSIDSVSDKMNEGRTPRNRKDTLKFIEYKRNRTESINKSKVNIVESASVVPDTNANEIPSSNLIKAKETTSSDHINNSETIFSELHITEGQPTSKNDFLSSEKLGPSETKHENKTDSLTETSTQNDLLVHRKLPETSPDIETTEIEVESIISEKPIISEFSLFDELKFTKQPTKCKQDKDLLTQIPPTISQFEDLISDLDHIESPSFSPLGNSSRLLDDSDGFEEFDEEFTSAIMDTVATAEKSVKEQKTLEEANEMVHSSPSHCSVLAEKTAENLKSTKEVKSKSANASSPSVSSTKNEEHLNFETVKQCFATEVSKSTENPKSDPANQGSSIYSSIPADDTSEDPKHTEKQKSMALKQNHSMSSALKPHEDVKLEEFKQSSSSVLARKSLDDSKSVEEPTAVEHKRNLVFNPFNFARKSLGDSKHTEEQKSMELKQNHSMNSPLKPQEDVKLEEFKQSTSSVLARNDSKSIEEPTAVEFKQSLVFNPFNLPKKPLENLKHTKDISSDEVKQSSAPYSNILAKSELKQGKSKKKNAKNPFKKLIPKKEETDFLGFNDEEIEEGQHSTSLRLSQSEDAELINVVAEIVKTESASTSGIKRIGAMKTYAGKKKSLEQEEWEKKSAKSLQNWLVVPEKSDESNNCDIKEEKFNEHNSSIPLKKRRGKVQNTSKSMHLEDNISEPATEVNLSAQDKSKNVSDTKQIPKRGRASKLKTLSTFDDNLSEDIKSSRENLNSSKSRSKKQNSILVDNTTIKEETSKIVQTIIVKEELNTPKRGRKPKIKNEPNHVKEKGKTPENLPENIKRRSRKRKLSVSEVNNSTICEPPAKQIHLDANIPSSSLFIQVKKKGRPPKCPKPNDGPSNVPTLPIIRTPTEKKYKGDTEFNPRLLLIRNKEELKNDEPLYDPNLQTKAENPGDVQCGLCMGYAPKKKWIQHVSNHYGIGWIVGQPPPLNIKSRSSVLSFLLEFFKVSKVKGLNCRLCNCLRRSALGLLMHLEQCCLTVEEVSGTRVNCEYCKKNYTKASYMLHKRTCPEYLKLTKETKPETCIIPEAEAQEDVLSNTGRLKRKSVIKAETKIKNLDDNEFVPDDLIKHISSKNLQSTETITAKWIDEIQTLGKGFCASKRCDFTATVVEELVNHYKENICPYYEQPGYICSRCKFYSNTMETVRSHVIEKHKPRRKIEKDNDAEIDSSESSDSISSGDDEAESDSDHEEENASGEKKPKKKKSPKKTLRKRDSCKHPPVKEYKKLLPERRFEIGYSVAKWFASFVKGNYSLDPLFTYAKTNLSYIEATESYFPRTPRSIKFHHNGFHGFVNNLGQLKIEPDKWKQLDRLNGFSQESEYTIFMGGPVKSIAWLPLDPHPPTNTQYLAVTVRKGLDKFTHYVNQKRSRSLIFILKFDINLPSKINAEIIYAVAIDEGPIHAIEFLPSGGYAPEANRIGMLAVGTIETEIKIYSLPLKVEKRDCDIFPIIRLEASIELHLERLVDPSDNTDYYCSQCTCMVWSQSAGHNVIVGGFLNGFIGIWDLSDDDDNLNRFLVNEKRIFVPVSYFWTGDDRLMHLALHYDMNGPRWLIASNSARKMMFYDLRDISNPMLFRAEVTINIITCMEWPVVWENVMVGLGNTMPSNGCVISVFSPLSIMFSNRRYDKFCTGVTAMHYNVWKNSIVAGSDNGDIQVTPLREPVLDVSQRLKNDDKTISTLDIVALNGDTIATNGIHISSDGMRVFDANHIDQYGIVFGSIKKISGHQKPEYYAPDRMPPLNFYRLTRVSQIKFNQNRNVSDVLAIGYDNGLLRVCVHDWLSRKAK